MASYMFPIGIDNFASLIQDSNTKKQHYLFVDKTLMIKEFIDAGDKIALITRPRRFGKTLSLSMMQHFFAKEVDGVATKGLFEGLAISKHPEVMALQGQFPVIFLTLKEVRGKNFEETYGSFKEIIRDLYLQHLYLLDSKKVSKYKKDTIDLFITKQASLAEYKTSIQFLTSLLYNHFEQKIIILLDEYDTPLHDAHVHGYYEEMRSLIATLFNKAFKGNDYLHKGLITGILQIVKSSLFSELNNVKVYSMISSSRYANCFGFTPEETDHYLDQAGLPQKAHELKEMYNGYIVEGYTLYNPLSIIMFADQATSNTKPIEKSLDYYWFDSGGTTIIRDLIAKNITTLEKDLSQLVNKIPIQSLINPNVILGKSLKTDRSSFWSLMLLSGYLKIENKQFIKPGMYAYTLSFTNEEIRVSMENIIEEAVSNNEQGQYYQAMQDLVTGNVEAFQVFLEDYLVRVPSFLDKGGKHYEQFYHGLVLGMSACLSHSHIVTSNRISGGGIYDICIEPKDKSQYGIILELKVAAKTERLQEVAETALAQIKTLDYKRDLTTKNITKFVFMGVSFNKSEMEIRHELVG